MTPKQTAEAVQKSVRQVLRNANTFRDLDLEITKASLKYGVSVKHLKNVIGNN